MKHFIIVAITLLAVGGSCTQVEVEPADMGGANALVDVTSTDQFNTAIGQGVSLIFYHASWCSKCAAQRPAVEAQTSKSMFSTVFFGQVEYEDFPDIVSQSKVNGFPTIVLFKDGKEVTRFNGQRNSEADIAKAIEAALN